MLAPFQTRIENPIILFFMNLLLVGPCIVVGMLIDPDLSSGIDPLVVIEETIIGFTQYLLLILL